LVAGARADIEDGHGQLVVEVAEAQLGPDVLLGCVGRGVPSMGLTSNSWHISLNFSRNLGSQRISSLYLRANWERLVWKLA
jgi:hypothetical protein